MNHLCYVCGSPIQAQALCIGQGLYRHPSSCEPGSVRYMRNRALARFYGSLFSKMEGRAMKKDEVKVGQEYLVKVSDKVVPVHIDAEHSSGKGWVGTNTLTGRQVRIKSAQRLRRPACASHADRAVVETSQEAPTANGVAHVEKKPARKSKGGKAKEEAPTADTGRQGEERGMSGLDAAAKVLNEASEPLSCLQIVERAFEKGYWQSEGKTPHATIYSAMLREIQKKGAECRFRKAERGKFELAR